MSDTRIPFEVAISEKRLLKDRFEELSIAQRTCLKVMYGCQLSADIKDPKTGFSELDYWAAGQKNAQYDEAGYITAISPLAYSPKQYNEAWCVWGRRAGKTDAISSTVVAYEAALGGHEQHVRKGQTALCFQIAQDLRMARYSLGFIRATIESSPLLKGLITAITADRIDLKHGVTIAVVPPTLKSVRGYACPVAVLDEVGVWYQDSDAANPDYEIWRAITPSQIQFPNRKLVGISSPWNKAGLLFQYFEAGTDGVNAAENEKNRYKDCLVWHGTTAGMGNPRITRVWLEQEAARDSRAFERECLAVFQDSLSGFLSSDLINAAVDKHVVERAPEDLNYYIAAIDPAFRRDAFAMTIVHCAEDGTIKQDVARRWVPEKGVPLDPSVVLAEVAQILKSYRCAVVYSDQYHLDTLMKLALQHGFAIEGVPFTATSKAAIYGNLQQLLNQKRLRLLDEGETIKELKQLERTLTQGGTVQISGPAGAYDDMAAVLALSTFKSTWLMPSAPTPIKTEPTPFERIQDQIAKRALVQGYDPGSWD